MTGESDLIDITAELHHETQKAFLLFDGLVRLGCQSPKSKTTGDGTFTMPEWLSARQRVHMRLL